MKKGIVALFALAWTCTAMAQVIKVDFDVTPPSGFRIIVDGEDIGANKDDALKLGFNERKGITSHEVVVSADGYEDKIYTFDLESPKKQNIKCELERTIASIEPVATYYIDFDKMRSGIEYSKDIGANTRWKFKEDEDIELQQRDDIVDALAEFGLKTLDDSSDDLFDTGTKKRKTADVLIAGRVEDFELSRKSTKGYQTAYSSNTTINWQFFDRHGQTIIHKSTVKSDYDFASSLITDEFHKAIVDNFYDLLNDDKELQQVLKDYQPSTMSGSLSDADEDEMEEATEDDKVDLVNIPSVELEEMDGFSDLVAMASNASVTVIIDNKGHGSGFVVSDNGYIVTNDHVIDEAKTIDVEFNNGIILPAEIISSSERYDIALLKVRVAGLTALPIADDPELVRPGDEVFVVGAPGDRELGQSVSKGIISGKRTLDGVKFIQTDTKISPGNSGSPLVNKDGYVVGVINMKLVGEGIEGLSFAIDARYLFNVLGIRYEDE